MKVLRRISQFLVFSAGASPEILDACPQSERVKYGSIGAIVFATGLVAALSSYYAFVLLTKNWAGALLLALGWGLMIYNLDRYLVASIRKTGNRRAEWMQALPRLVLAAGLALVISRPLELRLFESELLFQMTKNRRLEVEKATAVFQPSLDKAAAEIAQNRRTLASFLNRREAYYEEYRCECDGTCGTGVRGDGRACNRKKAKYEAASQEYETMRTETQEREARLLQQVEEIHHERKEAIKQVQSAYSTGLLSRFSALASLPGHTWLGIWALFFLLESLPVFTKLFADRGPYDLLLEEKELAYRLKLQHAVETGAHSLERARRLHSLETELLVREKELELYTRIKARAVLRMEQLRSELQLKLLQNPESDNRGEPPAHL